jgi:YbbR domain-containing protein
MNWLFSNWQLKLLALVLTLGMLGAVAFSENPIAFRTMQAKVDYVGPADGVALIEPARTVTVQVTGLADTVATLKPENIEVRADVSKFKPGVDTTLSTPVRVLVPGVSTTTGTVLLHVVTDTMKVSNLTVDVRTPNQVSGWKVDPDPKKTFAQCQPDTNVPCQLTVRGPASLLNGLKAYVDIQQPINNNVLRFPSQTVRFERNGQPVDFTKANTEPPIGWDPAIVSVQVTASSSSAQRMVAVNVPVTGRPACGYGVTGLVITPGNGVVTISGPADAVTSRESVGTDGVDVSNATSSISRDLKVQVPDPTVSVQPQVVHVTVSVARQFDCTAPTPPPTPLPLTPTPRPSGTP